jgi:hypothetical protein
MNTKNFFSAASILVFSEDEVTCISSGRYLNARAKSSCRKYDRALKSDLSIGSIATAQQDAFLRDLCK